MPWIVTKEESKPKSRGPSIKRWSQSCLGLDNNVVRYKWRELPETIPLGGTLPPIPLSNGPLFGGRKLFVCARFN